MQEIILDIRESIRIGKYVTMTILNIQVTGVRIGIEAPRDVAVDRAEIHARKIANLEKSDPRKTLFENQQRNNRNGSRMGLFDRHR